MDFLKGLIRGKDHEYTPLQEPGVDSRRRQMATIRRRRIFVFGGLTVLITVLILVFSHR